MNRPDWDTLYRAHGAQREPDQPDPHQRPRDPLRPPRPGDPRFVGPLWHPDSEHLRQLREERDDDEQGA